MHGGKKASKVFDGLTCNGCGKSFDDKATLALHKKRSGSQHNVRPECNVCKKQFSHGSNVLRHMMIHTGELRVCTLLARIRLVGRIPVARLLRSVRMGHAACAVLPFEKEKEGREIPGL